MHSIACVCVCVCVLLDDFDDLQYDDEGSSSKRGKKPKKATIGGSQLVDNWSYHQEQQRCDFYDCRTPRGDTVSWVCPFDNILFIC